MARVRPFFAPITAFAVILLSNSPLRAQEINWRHDYAAARQEAQQTGKPLFLDFGTAACVYCQQLDTTTFRVPAVARLINDSFIPMHIDANRERQLTSSMGVQRFPTLVVLDPSGKMIDRREGFCDPGTMTGFLEQGRRIASASAPRPQFRAQAREDRIPAKALAMAEPARPSPQVQDLQPSPGTQKIVAHQEALRLPSPEELGIGAEKPPTLRESKPIDWSALHVRLNKLGALSFLVQRPSAQIVRITSLFPIGDNRVHRVEASGATEAEAVRLFLEQVDEWSTHP